MCRDVFDSGGVCRINDMDRLIARVFFLGPNTEPRSVVWRSMVVARWPVAEGSISLSYVWEGVCMVHQSGVT